MTHRARTRQGTKPRPPRPRAAPREVSPVWHPEQVVLPLAWRADPSPTHRGPHLHALSDPAPDPADDAPSPVRPPIVRNAFVGRDVQLRETVRRLSLPDARIVTLVGRSGVGKTRLAAEVARRLTGAYPSGAVFLDFSQRSGRSVVAQLATALGVRVPPGQPAADAVRRELRFAPALIVADDVDVADGALDRLLDLVADAPAVRILATAQRATGHAEEHVVRLRPLPVPPADADAQGIRNAPAVALFLARAAAADPERPTPDADLPLIAELCRRLDGLPLAIELGAARARLLSPAGQLRALDGGDPLELRAPKGDPRPARHQDLRSAIETTWSMTEAPEQAVLRRMSVFAAPPALGHLQAVVADHDLTPAGVLDALATLVDLGLVEADMEPGGETRYRLLPTIRAFAREQLDAEGEAAATTARHADSWLAFSREARRFTETLHATALGRDAADLAVALAYFEDVGRAADALELASDLVMLWVRVGVSETAGAIHERLRAAADAPGTDVPAAICARGLVAASILAINGPTVGHMQAQAAGWLGRAVELARESGDADVLLYALEWQAVGVLLTGDAATAVAANAEGLALARANDWTVQLTRFEYRQSMFAAAAGDLTTAVAAGSTALRRARAQADHESIVRTGMHLAWFPRDLPGMPADLPTLEELLAVAQGAGCRFEESVLYPQLAFARLAAGDLPGAARWCEAGLAFAERHGAWQGATLTTVALMLTVGVVGDDVAVARMFGRIAPELAVATRSIAIPGALERFEAVIGGARQRLGEEAFAREAASTAHLDREAGIEWTAGVARRLAEGVGGPSSDAPTPASAAAGTPSPAGPTEAHAGTTDAPALTPRELQVLAELARGATNREIGATLGLTTKTVMHHSGSIYAKLGVRGRAEATAWAVRNGVLDGPRDA